MQADGRPRTVGSVAVVNSWRTPDGRWLVDRVIDEPGISYRIWYEGTPVGELPADCLLFRLVMRGSPIGWRAWWADSCGSTTPWRGWIADARPGLDGLSRMRTVRLAGWA